MNALLEFMKESLDSLNSSEPDSLFEYINTVMNRLDSHLENINAVGFTVNTYTRKGAVSPLFTKFFELPDSDVVTLLNNFKKKIDSYYRDEFHNQWQMLLQGQSESFEMEFILNTMSSKWWKCNIALDSRNKRENDDEIVYGLIWNIDHQKKMEAELIDSNNQNQELLNHLRTVLHESDINYFKIDAKKRLFVFNDFDLSLLPKGKKLIRGTYTDEQLLQMAHPNDREWIRSSNEPDLNLKIRLSEYRFDFFGDGYRWYEFRINFEQSLIGDDQNIVEGVCFDIQYRKDLEQQLLLAKEKAEAAERLKSAIIVNLSNEIRSPLQAILGYAEIMANLERHDDKNKYLNIIRSNNDLLLQMINEIIDFNEIESDDFLFKQEDVLLWEMCVELQQIHSIKINSAVRLVFQNIYDQVVVHIDKERLMQMISGLINAAVNNTIKGVVSYGYVIDEAGLNIYVKEHDFNESRVVRTKVDNDLFSLSDDTQSLSLIIAKNIIKKMGGEIYINSDNTGLQYCCILPFIKMHTNLQPLPTSLLIQDDSRTSDKPLILYAEDVQQNYEMITAFLDERYDFIHATNGIDAIELFKNHSPDLILMDLRMPLMDGLEATRKIRTFSSVPIIAFTAYALRSIRKEAADAGCNELLTKPVTEKQILSCMRKYLK